MMPRGKEVPSTAAEVQGMDAARAGDREQVAGAACRLGEPGPAGRGTALVHPEVFLVEFRVGVLMVGCQAEVQMVECRAEVQMVGCRVASLGRGWQSGHRGVCPPVMLRMVGCRAAVQRRVGQQRNREACPPVR